MDEKGLAVMVEAEADPGAAMQILRLVALPDTPLKHESLGTKNIPKESQIGPTYTPPAHDCVR